MVHSHNQTITKATNECSKSSLSFRCHKKKSQFFQRFHLEMFQSPSLIRNEDFSFSSSCCYQRICFFFYALIFTKFTGSCLKTVNRILFLSLKVFFSDKTNRRRRIKSFSFAEFLIFHAITFKVLLNFNSQRFFSIPSSK